ncbi:hypothetical protein ARMGADRAFT_1069006 [Armillaria gallica]|uniref:Uncharacterized protein n=1 Tax=Armillaria gallica TaxID=47427 RepID=A0A2H3CGH8_ARMGA|nr:hypothetical protein ARMGADRAFT_1069006 [Armillaria gallica]
MSSALLPSRGQCIHLTDNVQQCQCPWFVPTLLEPHLCGQCGHGIHVHADYVSIVVSHHPATQCVAYVQNTPLTQRCTCEVWLADHVTIENWYRSAEPWNVLGNVNVNMIDSSNDAISDPYTPSTISFSSSVDSDTAAVSHDVPITEASIFCPSPRYAFSPSRETTDIPTSSPLTSHSASSGIQLEVADTQAYGSDNHFVQYPDHFMNDSYARQSDDGGATDVAFYHHNHSNLMYGPTPEARSGPYA